MLRTGRFGVGALAAFLLGDEIEVITRQAFASEHEALKFTARLDDEFISLIRTSAPIGTQIRVKVPKRKKKKLDVLTLRSNETEISYRSDIGHYFLKDPSLLRYQSDGKKAEPKYWLPQPDDDFSDDWRWFSAPGFEKIFWTYGSEFPALACNGILINQTAYGPRRQLWNFISEPKLSVFDREGSLPVNLQRNGLQGPIPFKRELLSSICDDLIVHALIEAPTRCNSSWFFGGYDGFAHSYDDWPAWLIGRDGFILNEGHLVAEFKPRFLVIGIGGEPSLSEWSNKVQRALGRDGLLLGLKPSVLGDTNPRIKGFFLDALNGYFRLPSWGRTKGLCTYLPQPLLEKIKGLKPGRVVSDALAYLEGVQGENGWKRAHSDSSIPPSLDKAITSVLINPENPVVISVLFIEGAKDPDDSQPIADRWMEVLGTPIVPFALKHRQSLEEKATKLIRATMDIKRRQKKTKEKETKEDL